MPAQLALPTPGKPLPTNTVRALLGASVRLSQIGIVRYLQTRPYDEIPDAWRKAATTTASLRGLHPIIMQDRTWSGAGRPVHWHDTLGLRIPRS